MSASLTPAHQYGTTPATGTGSTSSSVCTSCCWLLFTTAVVNSHWSLLPPTTVNRTSHFAATTVVPAVVFHLVVLAHPVVRVVVAAAAVKRLSNFHAVNHILFMTAKELMATTNGLRRLPRPSTIFHCRQTSWTVTTTAQRPPLRLQQSVVRFRRPLTTISGSMKNHLSVTAPTALRATLI